MRGFWIFWRNAVKAGLQIHLERKLGKPVELIRKRKGLSERFLRRIERSIHYV
jgi:hypothetical protein